jgi:hypothetical protein
MMENQKYGKEPTCIVVLNKPRELLFILIFGHLFWIHLALFNKPGAKFWPFGKDAARKS